MASVTQNRHGDFPQSGPNVKDGFWMLPDSKAGIDWPPTNAITVAVDPTYVAPVLDRYPKYFKLILGTLPASIQDRLNLDEFNIADALFVRKAAGAHISILPMQIGKLVDQMMRETPSDIPNPGTVIEDLKQLARQHVTAVRLSGPPFLIAKPPAVDQEMEGSLAPETWSAAMAFRAEVKGVESFYAAVAERLGEKAMQRITDAGLAFDPSSLHATMAWTVNRKFGVPLKDSQQIAALTIVEEVLPSQIYPWTVGGEEINPATLVTNAAVLHALRKLDGATSVHPNDAVADHVSKYVLRHELATPEGAITEKGRALMSDPRITDPAFFANAAAA